MNPTGTFTPALIIGAGLWALIFAVVALTRAILSA